MEQVEQVIRKHETFQKVLTAQDEKGMGLGDAGRGQGEVVGVWELGEFSMGDVGARCGPTGNADVRGWPGGLGAPGWG